MKNILMVGLLVLAIGRAQALTVDNSSFETPDQGGNYTNYNNTTTADWIFASASNGAGIQALPSDGSLSGGSSTGVQDAWINLLPGEAGSITSTDSFTIVGGTDYVLTVALGDRSTLAPGPQTISLIDTSKGDSVLAFNTVTPAELTSGTFTDFTATLTPAESALVAGDSMTIQLSETNPTGVFVQGNYDNVRLDASVPEPSTYAMMGLGLAGLVFLFRRKLA